MPATSFLLAQVAPSRKLADGFRSSGFRFAWNDWWPWLLLVAIAVASYVVVKIRRQRSDMSLRCDDPAKLFRELCQAHQLDGASQRLLKQLANAAGHDSSGQIFLAPAAFNADQLPASLQSHATEIARLRTQLF